MVSECDLFLKYFWSTKQLITYNQQAAKAQRISAALPEPLWLTYTNYGMAKDKYI